MIDRPEMKCYCDHASHNYNCKNVIPYVHHHDWGNESDFKCQECIDDHGDDN